MTQQIQNPQSVQPPTQYASQQPMGGTPQFGGQPMGGAGQPVQQPASQQGYAPQTAMAQQPAQVQTAYGQQAQQGQRFVDSVSQDVQRVVSELDSLQTLAHWTKIQAENRGEIHIARRCADLVEVAHLQKDFLLRQSPSVPIVSQSTQQTIGQTLQELQQQSSGPDVQETIAQAQQVLNSLSGLVGTTMTGQGGQYQG